MAIDKKLIEEINNLAKKKKTIGLTDEEKIKQKKLYKKYISAFKGNLKSTLDTIEIVDKVTIYNDNMEKIINLLKDKKGILKIESSEKQKEIMITYNVKETTEEEIKTIIANMEE